VRRVSAGVLGLALFARAPREVAAVDPAPVRWLGPWGAPQWAPGLAADDAPRALGVGLRAELREGDVRRALSLSRSRFMAAVRCEGGWVFVTEDGRSFGSDTYLSALRPLVRGDGLRANPWSRGLAALLAGGDLWLTDGRTAWRVPPREVGALDAAFASPAHGVAIYRDGNAFETSDRGAHWQRLALPAPARSVRFDGSSLVIETAGAPHRVAASSAVALVPTPAAALDGLARSLRRDDTQVGSLRDGGYVRTVPGGIVVVDAQGQETPLGLVERSDFPGAGAAHPRLRRWGEGAFVASGSFALRVGPEGGLRRVPPPDGEPPAGLVLSTDGEHAVDALIRCAAIARARRCVVRAVVGASPVWRDVTFSDPREDGEAWGAVALHGASLLVVRGGQPSSTWATLDLDRGVLTPVVVTGPSALSFAHDGAVVGVVTPRGASSGRLRRADGSVGATLPEGVSRVAFADACRGLALGATLAETWRTTRCGAGWERVPVPPPFASSPAHTATCDGAGCVLDGAIRIDGWGAMTATDPPQDDPIAFEHETVSVEGEDSPAPATMACVEGAFVPRRGPPRAPTEFFAETDPAQRFVIPAHPNGTTRFTWQHRGRSLRADVGGHWSPYGMATATVGPIAFMTATTDINSRERERHDVLHVISDGRWRAWAPFGALDPTATVRLGPSAGDGTTAVVRVTASDDAGGVARELVARFDSAGEVTHRVVRDLPVGPEGMTAVGYLRGHAAQVRWSYAAPSEFVALDDPSVRVAVPALPARLAGCTRPRGADAVVMRSAGGSTGHRLVVTHPPRPDDDSEATPLFRFNPGDTLTAARIDLRVDSSGVCVERLWIRSVCEAGPPNAYCRLDGAPDGGFVGRCASRHGETPVRCTPR